MPFFRIRRWAAWSPGLPTQGHWQAWCQDPQLAALAGDAAPALDELPAMTRRRIDPLGRAALQVAFWAQGPENTGPMVFASRWGEIARSVSLLRELAQGAPLSPTAFSLSVHNASSALYSIARKDTANVTAISAGPCSAAAGVCEALGLLSEGAQQVLVVSVESSLPAPYASFETHMLPTRAWAALVELGGDLRLEAVPQESPDTADASVAPLPPDLTALRFLTGAVPELRQPGWHWTRHG